MKKILIINILHFFVIIFPVLLWTFQVDYVEAFLFSVTAVLVVAFGSSFLLLWIKDFGRPLDALVVEKSLGSAYPFEYAYFKGLWFIPVRSVVPVSDGYRGTCLKKYGPTIKALLHASVDVNYFVIGFVSLIGIYMGLSGDFGVGVRLFSKILNASFVLQFMLLLVSPWVALLYFFNGFVRFDLSRRFK